MSLFLDANLFVSLLLFKYLQLMNEVLFKKRIAENGK